VAVDDGQGGDEAGADEDRATTASLEGRGQGTWQGGPGSLAGTDENRPRTASLRGTGDRDGMKREPMRTGPRMPHRQDRDRDRDRDRGMAHGHPSFEKKTTAAPTTTIIPARTAKRNTKEPLLTK
jgi:hypothetical protein